MGECNYYLKARFRSETEVRAALPRLALLMMQGEKAYDYWQGSRRTFHIERGTQPPTTEEFWAGFRKRFPMVYHYLRNLAGCDDWSFYLAGNLGCLVNPLEERWREPNASLSWFDDLIMLEINGIWHHTDMRLLKRFIRDDLGAIDVAYVSGKMLSFYENKARAGDYDPFELISV